MKKADPKKPTPEERAERELTHLRFRNWFRHCVRGRGVEEACKKSDGSVEIPEVHMDFMFMGEERTDKTLAVLVAGGSCSSAFTPPRHQSGVARATMACSIASALNIVASAAEVRWQFLGWCRCQLL